MCGCDLLEQIDWQHDDKRCHWSYMSLDSKGEMWHHSLHHLGFKDGGQRCLKIMWKKKLCESYAMAYAATAYDSHNFFILLKPFSEASSPVCFLPFWVWYLVCSGFGRWIIILMLNPTCHKLHVRWLLLVKPSSRWTMGYTHLWILLWSSIGKRSLNVDLTVFWHGTQFFQYFK